jgi:hypothetical protein
MVICMINGPVTILREVGECLPSAAFGGGGLGIPHLPDPNPGPVRPRIAPPDTPFPELLAKMGTI